MEKDITYLKELIQTHLQSENFTAAGKELFSLIRNKAYEKDILHILEQAYASEENITYDQSRWDEVFFRIEMQIDQPKSQGHRKFKLRISLAIAATLLALSIISIIVYHNSNKSQDDLSAAIAKANIKPGKNTATLTLADGKKIILDEHGTGELAKESGISINKNVAGELIYTTIENSTGQNNINTNKTNTLSTANGQTAKVILPDGTKVWLNAASSITYPSSFAAAQRREVSLIGEAYFEAKHDEQHPFVVKSATQNVEVLGTSFNINGYTDQPATLTTLLAGRVKIQTKHILKYLKPGEQAQNSAKDFKITDNVDLADVVAWKDGYFVFSDNLENIMKKIAKWYDVKIIYENSPDLSTELQGKISRQKDLDEVLKLLEKYSEGLKFHVNGKTVIVQH